MKKKRIRKRMRKPEKPKKKLSIRELVNDILKRSKKALHYRELTKRLKKRGYKFHRKEPERSVYIIINRYRKMFKRTKPGVYRLK